MNGRSGRNEAASRSALLGLAVIMLAAFVACAESGAGDDAAVADSTADLPPLRNGTIDLRIGELDGPEEYMFARIGGIARDEEGRIYVADIQTDDIRAYGADGDFLFSFGRSGAGPGEFDGPCCIAFGPEGRLWVRDTGNARYSAFALQDSSARHVRDVVMSVHSAANLRSHTTFDASGHLVDTGMRPDLESAQHINVRLHLDSAGAVVDSAIIPDPPADSTGQHSVTRTEGNSRSTFYMHQPHGPRHLLAHAPGGGFATALSSSYRVRWFGTDGEERRIERPGVRGPELTAEERDAGERNIEQTAERIGIPLRDVPFGVPENKPPLQALHFDDRGRLWVELSVPAGAERRADIYSPDGEMVDRVGWPAAVDFRFGDLDSTSTVGISRDSLGVERVERVRFSG